MLTPAINSSSRRREMERKEMRCAKGGQYATHLCISFNYCDYWFWSTKQKGEKEAVKEKPWRGYARHLESIPQSTPAINSSDRLDGWVVRKMLQSRCVDIYISVNSLGIGSEGNQSSSTAGYIFGGGPFEGNVQWAMSVFIQTDMYQE